MSQRGSDAAQAKDGALYEFFAQRYAEYLPRVLNYVRLRVSDEDLAQDLTAQTLPTDYYVEPNDFEFYLMGFPEKSGHGGKAGQRSPAAEVLSNRISMGSAMEGRVGHMMP